jgi:hypothetical protein
MKIKATHRCQCGHPANAHTSGAFSSDRSTNELKIVIRNSKKHGQCGRCWANKSGTCKKFQLPNLDLIEYLAEKRGLI